MSSFKNKQIFTINQLLSVQAHVGNKISKWNPTTKNFIFGKRYNIHVFDLKKTTPFLKRMLFFLTNATKNHQNILFVGSHPIITVLIQFLAETTKQASISRKWVSGTLTNWLKIRPYIKFLYTTTVTKIKKKFVLRTEKKIEQKIIQYLKMKQLFSGMEQLVAIPNLVVVFENQNNAYVLVEASQVMLPVISLINTGSKAQGGITAFPIFGNDFFFDALFFYTNLIAQAIRNGLVQKRLTFLRQTTRLINDRKPRALRSARKLDLFFRLYKNYKSVALKRVLRKSFYFLSSV
jgi:small subunit ribosomal protein S2